MVTNQYGDQVVRLKEENIESGHAKIGQSLGTSETIYSEGLPFIEESRRPTSKIKPLLKTAVLCDNPGFHDTRGSDYEICTNWSIDQAMQCAKKIKAVVLVIAFDTFKLDRANPLVEIASLIQERFPDIFTTHRDSFYIIITKCTEEGQKGEAFQNRLKKHIFEEEEKIHNIMENDHR